MEYILEIPNSISQHKCKEIIRRFEDDTRKLPGVAGTPSTIQPVKKSLDLGISGRGEWADIDKLLHSELNRGLEKYKELLKLKSHLNYNSSDLRKHILKLGKPTWIISNIIRK